MARLFVYINTGPNWLCIGILQPGDPPGTCTDNSNTPSKILFGIGPGGEAAVIRRIPSENTEDISPEVRVVKSLAGDTLARLALNESYETSIMTPRGYRVRMKWHFAEDPVSANG